jgi:8-oxo-dGTP pyrophosphatase MutT (NUDIX family)
MPELVRQALEIKDVRTVHRLDRVVSGLMVLALSPEAASELSRQIRDDQFEKEYLAVVHGAPEQNAFFFEKVCGIVPYCVKDGVRHYLAIQNLSGHIGFPKGHTENGETETETAKREAAEEAGVQVETLPGFRFCFSYRAQEHALRIHKYAVYFIGEFSLEQIIQIQAQPEEILNWWLLPYEEILGMLNKPNDKALLTRAEEFLAKKAE